jgi:protein TonB
LVALLCAPPPAGAVSQLTAALGSSEPPFVPLSEEEAHHALERDLLLKVGKYLQVSDYPGEARRWRWTGTVLVEVLVAADGMVKQVALSRTSGFRVLDMQALEVVRRVSKLFVPVGLRQRDRTVTVPVIFHLQKS